MLHYKMNARWPSLPVQILILLIFDAIRPKGEIWVKLNYSQTRTLPDEIDVALRDRNLRLRTPRLEIDIRDGKKVFTLEINPLPGENGNAWRQQLTAILPELWQTARRGLWQHPDAGRFPQRLRLTIRQFTAYLHADQQQGRWSYMVGDPWIADFADAFRQLYQLGLLVHVDRGTAVERNVIIEVVAARHASPIKRKK